MFDVTAIENFIAEDSGKVSNKNWPWKAPYTLVTPLADIYYEDSYYSIELDPSKILHPETYGGQILFVFGQPTALTSVTLRCLNTNACVLLVLSPTVVLRLYSYGSGDYSPVSNTSLTNITIGGVSYTEHTITWVFPEVEVTSIIPGMGGGGYAQEYVTTVTGIETSAEIKGVPSAFWTNFKGQSESE